MLKSVSVLMATAALGLAILVTSGTNTSASPATLSTGNDMGNLNLVEVTGRDPYRRTCLYGGCPNYTRGLGYYYHHNPNYDPGRNYGHGHFYPFRGYSFGWPWRMHQYSSGDNADWYYEGGYYYLNRNGSAHAEWCSNRYRSYKPRTNTWTSYSGQVRRCVSPYS
jgi:hypothetical protein